MILEDGQVSLMEDAVARWVWILFKTGISEMLQVLPWETAFYWGDLEFPLITDVQGKSLLSRE